jgi:hypothetical protein
MSTRITIKDIRFNFTQTLFTAKKPQQGEGKEKFSVVAIFPKNHPQLAEIQAAVIEAATNKWGAKAQETLKALKAADRICVHDGDTKADKPGFGGNYFINASNELRPTVVGPQREPLVAADGKPYSGSYGNIILEFWAQDNSFGKRVNASLMGAQHVKDGERLSGGGVAAADDFEAIPPAEGAKVAAGTAGAAALFG